MKRNSPDEPSLVSGSARPILAHNFLHGCVEICLRDAATLLTESTDTSLVTDSAAVRSVGAVERKRNAVQVDTTLDVHLARVDAEDLRARLGAWMRQFDAPVNATGAQQCVVEHIDAVRRHDELYLRVGLKAVKLRKQLQHCALHFALGAATLIAALSADAIGLVDEDDAGLVLLCHLEQLTNHLRALADVLTD